MEQTFVCLLIAVLSLLNVATTRGNTRQDPEISEIVLEMTPGSSEKARAFKITFRKDGTARYEGLENVKLMGKYKGTISRADFDQLAEMIRTKKFRDLKSASPSARSASFATSSNFPGFIATSVSTSVVTGGKRTTIERVLNAKINNPDAPPKELLEIESAITALATRVSWEKETK